MGPLKPRPGVVTWAVADAAWRALAYCVHPRVIVLSLLPVWLVMGLTLWLAYHFWYPAQEWAMQWLQGTPLLEHLQTWLQQYALAELLNVLVPLLLLALVTPLLVLCSLLLVGVFMTPAMVKLVAQRRFPALARKRGARFWGSVWWSLRSTFWALLALCVSVPLWWLPPVALLWPPVVWGWLSYRIFAFDALSDHADAAECQTVLRQHRWPLWAMGLGCGLLGAAPSALWVSGAMFIAMAPLLVPLAVWVYALVFAFSSLWFAHYVLAALDQQRTWANHGTHNGAFHG